MARIRKSGHTTANNFPMKSVLQKFGLLFWFWLLGTSFGAGVVDLLWARRDHGNVRSLGA